LGLKRGEYMDGTWKPNIKIIKYFVCPVCKELVKKEEIINNGLKSCVKCTNL